VVYRSLRFNKGFIAGIALTYDHFIIVDDFNIHVCCESRLLSKDFVNLIDSFNFVQSVTGPTHEKGHTLKLGLSNGLDVAIREMCDTRMLDQLPVALNVVVSVRTLCLLCPHAVCMQLTL